MDRSSAQKEDRARQRASIVMQVRSGLLTAEEGAGRLGVSRKTYYEWETRALRAMTEAMEEKAAGRPRQASDEETERLQDEVAELRKKLFLAEKTVEVRDLLHAYELHKAGAERGAGRIREKKRKRRKGR